MILYTCRTAPLWPPKRGPNFVPDRPSRALLRYSVAPLRAAWRKASLKNFTGNFENGHRLPKNTVANGNRKRQKSKKFPEKIWKLKGVINEEAGN